MIRIQVRSIHQHAVRTFIQIWNLLREPWHVFHLWRKKQPSNIEYLYSTLKKSHLSDIVIHSCTAFFRQAVVRRVHLEHVHVFPQQLNDLVKLLAVAVAVYEDLELWVTPFGFSGLDVHQVDVVFLLIYIWWLMLSFLNQVKEYLNMQENLATVHLEKL